MKDGFIKVAAGSVAITVADVTANVREIKARITEADAAGVNLLVLPELCITGYTCGDLFFAQKLQKAALDALIELKRFTADKYPVVLVGLPVLCGGKLYNCAAALCGGKILGLVPKTHLPNYGEFYEKRQFTSGAALRTTMEIDGEAVSIRPDQLFACAEMPSFRFGVEICEDLWAPCPPSEKRAEAGALVIANLSASDETIGKDDYRRMLVSATSARLLCGYIYASAGPEESTQDMVCSRHHLIAENGTLLAENKPFAETNLLITELDVDRLANERCRNTTFESVPDETTPFHQELRVTPLTRVYAKNPFVPSDETALNQRAEAILNIQSNGLKKRLAHAHAATAVIGISGGLDSTLALLVTVRAMDLLGRPRRDIIAVTMPCFGTTHRTKNNAVTLCGTLGVTLREVNITAAVNQHFADIGQDPSVLDVTFENSQARERTQVLMDIANKTGGLVIGTGDLSELALGWATYNGDHMSMYGVNTSVPKTLVRYIVRYVANRSDEKLAAVLLDILDTPVSPELLPVDEHGDMTQKTEDLVGPYELHDFFLYHTLRFGSTPSKIFRLARRAYAGVYSDAVILHWLRTFTRRFFNQQFKRSCMPDGPKVGSVTLSPRGDWRMPSDASSRIWLDEIGELEKIYQS